MTISAPVAQLDRVPGYEPGGREFESLRARQTQNTRNSRVFLFGRFEDEIRTPDQYTWQFDKIAGSDFEQRSEAELAPKGWSTGMYGIISPGAPCNKKALSAVGFFIARDAGAFRKYSRLTFPMWSGADENHPWFSPSG
jgi:hypothetical protein